MTLTKGNKWPVSDKTTVTSMVELGEAVHGQMKVQHKVDKNWTVAAHQSYNVAAKGDKYNLGFDVAYTL